MVVLMGVIVALLLVFWLARCRVVMVAGGGGWGENGGGCGCWWL